MVNVMITYCTTTHADITHTTSKDNTHDHNDTLNHELQQRHGVLLASRRDPSRDPCRSGRLVVCVFAQCACEQLKLSSEGYPAVANTTERSGQSPRQACLADRLDPVRGVESRNAPLLEHGHRKVIAHASCISDAGQMNKEEFHPPPMC